jgi:hypothetical protein
MVVAAQVRTELSASASASSVPTNIQGGAQIATAYSGTAGLLMPNLDLGSNASPIGNIFQASYIQQVEGSDPSAPDATKGIIYMKTDANDTQLWFRNNSQSPVQITGTGASTTNLQEAYDAGNQIIEDATGTVQMTQGVAAAVIPTLTLDYSATTFTAATDASSLAIDLSTATAFNAAGDIFGIDLTGVSNSGAGDSVAVNIDSGWDQGIINASTLVQSALATFSAGVTNSSGELLVSGGNMQLNDSIVLSLGTDDDVSMRWDGTDFDVLFAADDQVWHWGVDNGNVSDMIWHGNATGDAVTFDASANTWTYDDVDLYLGDNDVLAFGDSQDFQIVFDATDTTLTASTGDITISAGTDLVLDAGGMVGVNQALVADTGGVTAGNPIAISSAGKFVPADATTSTKLQTVVGFALNTALAAAEVLFALPGTVVTVSTDLSSDTVQDVVYLSETAGVITTTAPSGSGSTVYRVGVIVDVGTGAGDGKIMFMPQFIANNP